MKNLFSVVLTTIFISLTLLTSCAKEGFQTSNVSLPDGNNDGSGGGNNNPPNLSLEDQIKRLDMGTYLFNSPISGIDPSKGYLVADLDKTGDGQIIINIPLGITPLFSLGAGAHQKYKDISFSLQGSITSGFSLNIKVPLKYILRLGNFENTAPGHLPNGDPIPEVPGGELPKLNITVNSGKKEKIHLYLSKEYVGILFESKFDPGVDFSTPLTDRNDLNTLGYFHIISAKNNAPAAFLLLLKFKPQISTLLDDYFLN